MFTEILNVVLFPLNPSWALVMGSSHEVTSVYFCCILAISVTSKTAPFAKFIITLYAASAFITLLSTVVLVSSLLDVC